MPTDITKTVAELRALMAKATPGPWEVMTGSLDVWAVNERVSAYPWAYKTDRGRVNAALIVAAINALPELLAAAERAPAAKKPDCPLCGWHRSEGESHGCSHPDCEFNPYCASPLDVSAPAVPDVGEVGKLASHLAHMACFGGGKYVEFLTKEKVREAATALERQAATIAWLTAERGRWEALAEKAWVQGDKIAWGGVTPFLSMKSSLAAVKEENARLSAEIAAMKGEVHD